MESAGWEGAAPGTQPRNLPGLSPRPKPLALEPSYTEDPNPGALAWEGAEAWRMNTQMSPCDIPAPRPLPLLTSGHSVTSGWAYQGRKLIGSGVAWMLKLLPATVASHASANSHPSCSTSHQFPEKAAKGGLSAWPLILKWETRWSSLAPDLCLAQMWPLQVFGSEHSRWKIHLCDSSSFVPSACHIK